MNYAKMTGYPTIDKPWLKFYTEEQRNSKLPHMSAYDYMKECNKDNLDLTAITYLERQWTYSEVIKETEKTISALVNMGVKPGEVVSMVLPLLPEEIFLFYAVDAIGAISNFMLPALPKEKICSIMQEHESRFLFIFPQFLEDENYIYDNSNCENIVLTGLGEYTCNNENTLVWDSFQKLSELPADVVYKTDSSKTCFIAKTGGSTGEAKSVMLSDNSFNSIVAQYKNTPINYHAGDSWLRIWPIFSAAAATVSNHLPLCFGMNMILLPMRDMATELAESFMYYKPNHFPMAPLCLEILMESPLIKNQDLSFLRSAGIGGCGMAPEFEERAINFYKEHNVDCALGGGFGLSENGSSTIARLSRETTKFGDSGIPLPHNVMGIFDPETEQELKYYEQGEICIQSPSFMNGYWKQPELTKQVLRTHSDGSVWLHTGDFGYIDEDGFLFVKGRMKTVIFLYHTGKVYPSEMEDVISKIDGVQSVAVISEPDMEHKGYKRPACFVVCQEGENADDVKDRIVQDFHAKEIPSKHPQHIYMIDTMPLTPMGKNDLQLLEKMAKEYMGKN